MATKSNWPWRRTMVFERLEDGNWHSTAEINSADCGGTEGTRRLRELRGLGYKIEKRQMAESTQFEYRMGYPDPAVWFGTEETHAL